MLRFATFCTMLLHVCSVSLMCDWSTQCHHFSTGGDAELFGLTKNELWNRINGLYSSFFWVCTATTSGLAAMSTRWNTQTQRLLRWTQCLFWFLCLFRHIFAVILVYWSGRLRLRASKQRKQSCLALELLDGTHFVSIVIIYSWTHVGHLGRVEECANFNLSANK